MTPDEPAKWPVLFQQETEPVQIGKVYLLKGGHIMRYQGLWGGKGPCLAFRDPTHGLSEPPSGASMGPGDVLREMTSEDLPELQSRIDQMKARNLLIEAVEIEHVVLELTA